MVASDVSDVLEDQDANIWNFVGQDVPRPNRLIGGPPAVEIILAETGNKDDATFSDYD